MIITSIAELASYREKLLQSGKTIVTTNGCFDILHPGHIATFETAKKYGDILIVLVNSDTNPYWKNKVGRPIVPENQRLLMLDALRSVDVVVPFDSINPIPLLEILQPRFHIKGGDYHKDTLPETAVVQKHGGDIVILPILEGYSTTQILEKAENKAKDIHNSSDSSSDYERARNYFRSHAETIKTCLHQEGMLKNLEPTIALFRTTLTQGNKLLICGNGGSAADSQHFAAELVGRYIKERRGLPAIALTTDTSILTAIGNDYGFHTIFARQVEALGNPGDVLVVLSTSGNSENIMLAIEKAKQKSIPVVALVGKGGGKIAPMADIALIVPSDATPHIQEVHMMLYHFLCECIDNFDL